MFNNVGGGISTNYFNLNINDHDLQVRKESITKKIQLLLLNKELVKNQVHEKTILDIKSIAEKNLEKAEKELTFIYTIFIDELNKKYETLGQYISNSHISQFEKDNFFKELKQIPIFKDHMDHLEISIKKLDQIEKTFFNHLAEPFISIRNSHKFYVEQLLSDDKTFHISQKFIDFLDRLNAHITHPFKNPLLIHDVQSEHNELTLIYNEAMHSNSNNNRPQYKQYKIDEAFPVIRPNNPEVAKTFDQNLEATESLKTECDELHQKIYLDKRITSAITLQLLLDIKKITDSEIKSKNLLSLIEEVNKIKNTYLINIKLEKQEINDMRKNLAHLMNQLSIYSSSPQASLIFEEIDQFDDQLEQAVTYFEESSESEEEVPSAINGRVEQRYLELKQKAVELLKSLQEKKPIRRILFPEITPTFPPIQELFEYDRNNPGQAPSKEKLTELLDNVALTQIPLSQFEYDELVKEIEILKNEFSNSGNLIDEGVVDEFMNKISLFEAGLLTHPYAIKIAEWKALKDTCNNVLQEHAKSEAKKSESLISSISSKQLKTLLSKVQKPQEPTYLETLTQKLLNYNDLITQSDLEDEIKQRLSNMIFQVLSTYSDSLSESEAFAGYEIVEDALKKFQLI